MTFPVTATSHRLADYRARGGCETLEKALREMRPEQKARLDRASPALETGVLLLNGSQAKAVRGP